jgi:hypothetical protein
LGAPVIEGGALVIRFGKPLAAVKLGCGIRFPLGE